jgi:hypothetical protein
MKHHRTIEAIMMFKYREVFTMGSIFDMSGFGGILAFSIISALITCYGMTIRWIAKGRKGRNQSLSD